MSAEPPQLSRFDGPLDLLLDLITRRQLDITTISLAAVAEQYVAEVARLAEVDLERLAGYLVIASRLLLIKSQALLPRPPEVALEEDAGTDLVRQLEEYRHFRELATQLRQMEEIRRRMFARQATTAPVGPPPAGGGSPIDLASALRRALARAPEPPPAETTALPKFPVAEKLAEIQARLQASSRCSLSALVEGASCRAEVVAYFLAMLELLRRGLADVRQDRLFGEVVLTPTQGTTEPEGTGG